MVDLSTIPDLLECVAEALCLFEIWFPLGFFDIMTHFPVHLVEEFIGVSQCMPIGIILLKDTWDSSQSICVISPNQKQA